ncbi:MAG: TIR domain-containing protein [Planctomycetaceae bacterium]
MTDNSEISKAFLSHNSRDKTAVKVIKGLLEQGDRPVPCWFDENDLRSQGTWISQLEDAVATCGAAVVFYGPDGHGPVHKYEIDLLLKRAMYDQGRDAIRLVLVLLPGAQETEIQGFVSLHMWADFRKGLDDAAALQRLRAFILGEAPKSGLGDDPLIPKPEIEPYRGLEAFEGKHASYFFGRDNEIKELCGRLREWPFTTVIGGSGSGKSSVVRAGLQTDLAKKERPTLAHTTTITVRPGTNPIRALAEQVAASQAEQSAAERLKFVDDLDARFRCRPDALLNVLKGVFVREDEHVLLVIDQFEELFTHSTETQQEKREGEAPAEPRFSDSQQTQFVELLAAVAKSQLDRLRIVITLRADFFDRCLSLPTLKSLIENRTLLLGKLSDDALRTVIEAPAFQVGAYFEKGLVARILKDVENQNGSLPLLQHALKELWAKRRFGFLTDDGYDETGGVEGALKKRADATLQNLSEDQRDIAKNIFLRLTTLGEGVSDTRRRVNKTELYPEKTDPRAIDEVLKGLSSQANRMIVTNDDGTVEVTHEALIQRWDTLKGWLAENRDDKRLHDRLRDAANEWADPLHTRDPSYLWEGGRLDLAETFDQSHPNILTALEREFLGASLADRQLQLDEKERQRRRLTHLAIGLASALVLSVGLSWWAVTQKTIANKATVTAEAATKTAKDEGQRARRSLAFQLAKEAMRQLDKSATKSLLLAVEAANATRNFQEPIVPAAEQALRDSLARIGGVPLHGPQSPVIEATFSSDGSWLAASCVDGQVFVWKLATSTTTPILSFRATDSEQAVVLGLLFSSDNRRLAFVREDNLCVTYPLDDLIATSGGTITAQPYDVLYPYTLNCGDKICMPLYIDSDPRVLLEQRVTIPSGDREFVFRNLVNGTAHPLVVPPQEGATISAAEYDSRFNIVLMGDSIGRIFRWSLTEEMIASGPTVIHKFDEPIANITISPTGGVIGVTGKQGLVSLLEFGTQMATPKVTTLQRSVKDGLAQSPRDIIVSSNDSLVGVLNSQFSEAEFALWRKVDGSWQPMPNGLKDVLSVAFSPRSMIVAHKTSNISMFNIEAFGDGFWKSEQQYNSNEGEDYSYVMSSDCRLMVSFDKIGNVRLWDLARESMQCEPSTTGFSASTGDVKLSRDGRWLAIPIANDVLIRDLQNGSFDDAGVSIPLGSEVKELMFAGNSGHVVFRCENKAIYFSKLPTRSTHHQALLLRKGSENVTPDKYAVSFDRLIASANGRWMSSTDETPFGIWDLEADDPTVAYHLLPGLHTGHWHPTFADNGRWLLTYQYNDPRAAKKHDDARLWSLCDRKPVEIKIPFELSNALTSYGSANRFSPNGEWLIAGGKLWSLANRGMNIHSYALRQPESTFSPAWYVFDSECKWLVTATTHYDGRMYAYRLKDDGQEPEVVLLNGHRDGIAHVAFVGSEQRLVSMSGDESLRLWDLSSHRQSVTSNVLLNNGPFYPTIHDRADCRVYPAENHRCFIAGQSGYMAMWKLSRDPLNGAHILLSRETSDEIPLGFSIGDRMFLTKKNGSVVSRFINDDDLLAVANEVATRNFAKDEWLETFPSQPYRRTFASQAVHFTLIQEAKSAASVGDISRAAVLFGEIAAAQPGLFSDPMTEANRCFARTRITEANTFASELKIADATAKLIEAKKLDPTLPWEPRSEARRRASPTLMQQGRTLAGMAKVDEAIAKFRQAIEYDSAIALDAVVEARKLAAPKLVENAKLLARKRDLNGAIGLLRQAAEFDPSLRVDPDIQARLEAAPAFLSHGDSLAWSGEYESAIDSYRLALKYDKAIKVDPDPETRAKDYASRACIRIAIEKVKRGEVDEAVKSFTRAQSINPDLRIEAQAYNELCWNGCLYGKPNPVKFAGDEAVKKAPDNCQFRDTRGVARALTGDYPGAIEDFEAYVNDSRNSNASGKKLRQSWILALKAGENPFTSEVLGSLLKK